MLTDQHLIDLECLSLSKSFGNFIAVKDLSFKVPIGSFFSILGPSGCGKTTLLRMLAGFETPDSGDILIKEKSVLQVPPNHRPVNMVFQHLALFPNMSVSENIAYGLKRRKMSPTDIEPRVQQMLDRIDLPDSGNKQISQLSGGQKQRIAIARCLVLEPALLLLDEPLGALDLKLREQMKIELKRMQAQFGTTFIYITHDQSEALVMSDQVAVMNEGVFEQIASPQELYHNPATAFVAAFVGDSNKFLGTICKTEQQGCEIKTKLGVIKAKNNSLDVGEPVSIFVRPEAISIDLSFPQTAEHLQAHNHTESKANHFKAIIENVLFDGARSQLIAKHPLLDTPLNIAYPHATADIPFSPGQEIDISWNAEDTLLFSASGALNAA